MNLCLNAFVIQFPDGLLDTCSVSVPGALLLPYAHRDHCKDEDSYKDCSSHVEFSIRSNEKKLSHLAMASLRSENVAYVKVNLRAGQRLAPATC